MTWPHKQADRVMDLATVLDERVHLGDVLAVLRNINAIQDQLVEIAQEVVEIGARQGLTQKALAEALGVPASTLAGLKRAVR